MVSGRVERVEPDEWETVGSLDQHESAFVAWESSACRLKLHPRISTACPMGELVVFVAFDTDILWRRSPKRVRVVELSTV
jgi:hypothetical protein